MDVLDRYSQAKRITLIGSSKNIFLSAIKIIFGILGHSHALVADGIHSLSDLLIDALVIIASHFGSKVADYDHPYGHGRIETAATVLLAFIMSLAGVGIIVDAIWEMFGRRVITTPSSFVLIIALISLLTNELLYFYTHRVGKAINSNLLVANAWHHRSDSAASLVVFIGVLGAIFGLNFLDPLAALIVGVMIIKMGWQFGWNSVRELIDTGLEKEMLSKIENHIHQVAGVKAVHQLRTRSVGGAIFLDVHILVDPFISVSEGHFIGEQVQRSLLKGMPEITDVVVHIDPEDDELVAPKENLSRKEVVALLKEKFPQLLPAELIEKMVIHYLGGKVFLEFKLPITLFESQEKTKQLHTELKKNLANIEDIDTIEIVYHCER